jgi:hypothetical protein
MFTDTDDQSKTETEQPSTVTLEDQLKLIVNSEGKQKYETVDKAIAALKASQEFIPKLESDNKTLKEQLDELKAELGKRSSVEDVVSKLLHKEDKTGTEPAKVTPTDSGKLDEKSVEQMLSSLLEKRDAESSQKVNQKKVEEAFTEKFGTDAKVKFQELAKEIDVTVEELQQLSAKSPNMVLKLIPNPVKPTKVTNSGFNTTGFLNRPVEDAPLQVPNKSLLAGASSREQVAALKSHRDAVYKKHNVQQ